MAPAAEKQPCLLHLHPNQTSGLSTEASPMRCHVHSRTSFPREMSQCHHPHQSQKRQIRDTLGRTEHCSLSVTSPDGAAPALALCTFPRFTSAPLQLCPSAACDLPARMHRHSAVPTQITAPQTQPALGWKGP